MSPYPVRQTASEGTLHNPVRRTFKDDTAERIRVKAPKLSRNHTMITARRETHVFTSISSSDRPILQQRCEVPIILFISFTLGFVQVFRKG